MGPQAGMALAPVSPPAATHDTELQTLLGLARLPPDKLDELMAKIRERFGEDIASSQHSQAAHAALRLAQPAQHSTAHALTPVKASQPPAQPPASAIPEHVLRQQQQQAALKMALQALVQVPNSPEMVSNGTCTAAALTLAVALSAAEAGSVPPAVLRMVSPFRAHLDMLHPLGKGAFGQVVAVQSRLDRRLLAVKQVTFKSDVPPWAAPEKMETRHAKLLREVQALSRLEGSPHVVRYYSAFLEPQWDKLGRLLAKAPGLAPLLAQARSTVNCPPAAPLYHADLRPSYPAQAAYGGGEVPVPPRQHHCTIQEVVAGSPPTPHSVGHHNRHAVDKGTEALGTGHTPVLAHTVHIQSASTTASGSSSRDSGTGEPLNAVTRLPLQTNSAQAVVNDSQVSDSNLSGSDRDSVSGNEESVCSEDESNIGSSDADVALPNSMSQVHQGLAATRRHPFTRPAPADTIGVRQHHPSLGFDFDEGSHTGSGSRSSSGDSSDSDEDNSENTGSSGTYTGSSGYDAGYSQDVPQQPRFTGHRDSSSRRRRQSAGKAPGANPVVLEAATNAAARFASGAIQLFHPLAAGAGARAATAAPRLAQHQEHSQGQQAHKDGVAAAAAGAGKEENNDEHINYSDQCQLARLSGIRRWPYVMYICMELLVGGSLDAWLKLRSTKRAAARAADASTSAPSHASSASLLASVTSGALSSSMFRGSGDHLAVQGLAPAERSIFLQVVKGLVDVHAAGLLHRDLKPANIFIKTVAVKEQPQQRRRHQQQYNPPTHPPGSSFLALPPCSSTCPPSQHHAGGEPAASSFHTGPQQCDSHHDVPQEQLLVKIGDFGLSVQQLRHPFGYRTDDKSASESGSGQRSSESGSRSSGDGSSNDLGEGGGHGSSGSHTSGVGTRSYCAPEQLEGSGEYGPAVDIYPLGLILMELACDFPTGMERAVNMRDARAGRLPSSMHASFPFEAALAAACLSDDPRKRPTANQLLEVLTAMWEPTQGGGGWQHQQHGQHSSHQQSGFPAWMRQPSAQHHQQQPQQQAHDKCENVHPSTVAWNQATTTAATHPHFTQLQAGTTAIGAATPHKGLPVHASQYQSSHANIMEAVSRRHAGFVECSASGEPAGGDKDDRPPSPQSVLEGGPLISFPSSSTSGIATAAASRSSSTAEPLATFPSSRSASSGPIITFPSSTDSSENPSVRLRRGSSSGGISHASSLETVTSAMLMTTTPPDADAGVCVLTEGAVAVVPGAVVLPTEPTSHAESSNVIHSLAQPSATAVLAVPAATTVQYLGQAMTAEQLLALLLQRDSSLVQLAASGATNTD